jgi:hypothetical protein
VSEPKPTPETLHPLDEHRLKARLREAQAGQRDLLSELAEEQAKVAFLTGLARETHDPPPIVAREKRSARHEGTIILSLSDWHVEETVKAEEVGGLNEFNVDVASRRVDRLIDGFLWLYDLHHGKKMGINRIVVAVLGDMITGWIHAELQSTNSLPPPAAVVFVDELLRRLFTRLLDETTAELDVPFIPGNHGRITTRKSIKQAGATSFEWLAYCHLAQWLQRTYPGRVRTHVAQGTVIHQDVYGLSMRFIHGDQIGYQGGVGGVTIPLNKWILRSNQGPRGAAHCTYGGHFHQLVSGKAFVLNGSLIGWSDFAEWIGAEYEAPKQAFTLIDSRYGRTATWPIFCEESAKLGSDPRLSPRDVLDAQASGEPLSTNPSLTINGQTKTRGEWAKIAHAQYGVHPDSFRRRIRAGWTPEDALHTPPHQTGFRAGHGGRRV